MKSKILLALTGFCLCLGLGVLASSGAAAGEICNTDEGRFYGPVQPGESLWTIAQATASQDSAVPLTAAAIRNINPRAFIDGNANLLRTCQFLRLPNRRELRRVSSDDLKRIFSN